MGDKEIDPEETHHVNSSVVPAQGWHKDQDLMPKIEGEWIRKKQREKQGEQGRYIYIYNLRNNVDI